MDKAHETAMEAVHQGSSSDKLTPGSSELEVTVWMIENDGQRCTPNEEAESKIELALQRNEENSRSAGISQEQEAKECLQGPPRSSQDTLTEEVTDRTPQGGTKKQGTRVSDPLPFGDVDTIVSNGERATSLLCSPMSPDHRRHEATPVYALVDMCFKAEETRERASETHFTQLEASRVFSPSILRDRDPSNIGTPQSPVRPGTAPHTSSPVRCESPLQFSSPVPVPSSPPTSSPPLNPSSPSAALDIPGGATKLSLTDLTEFPNARGFGTTETQCLSKGFIDHIPSPTRNSPVIVERDVRNELTATVQKEQGTVVSHPPPNPKRPTAAARQKQHEKLSKPFRPPYLTTQAQAVEGLKGREITYTRTMATPEAVKAARDIKKDDRIKRSTKKATSQFKSPLVICTDNAAQASSPTIRLTPTIQMLERKLQILKRAVKIREDDQEDVLRGLITKWTETGREIAWEVWTIVKDNTGVGVSDDCPAISGKRSLQDDWHWGTGDEKRHKEEADYFDPHSGMAEDSLEGTDTRERVDLMKVLVEDEEPEKPHYTLGTMLRLLGIDPQTLGWDDGEETFKDFDGEV